MSDLRAVLIAALEQVDADEDRCGCRCCDVDTILPLIVGWPA